MKKKKPVSNKLQNNYKFKKKETLWQIAAGKLGFSETE